MIAVGVDQAESVELEKIAPGPANHVYKVPDYEGLADITSDVVQRICQAGGIYVPKDHSTETNELVFKNLLLESRDNRRG